MEYIHRQYTYVIVYGDNGVWRPQLKLYIISPIVILGVVTLVYLTLDTKNPSPIHQAAFALAVLWTVWHAIIQRYGTLRGYAAKAGGELASSAHARCDKVFIWCMVFATTCASYHFRVSEASAGSQSGQIKALIEPIIGGNSQFFFVFSLVLLISAGLWWLYKEAQVSVSKKALWPRWQFMLATMLLFSIFPTLFMIDPLSTWLFWHLC